MTPPRKTERTRLTVIVDDGSQESHDLDGDKDWAVIFESVLEVKSRDGLHYYPFNQLLKWSVKKDTP